MKFEFSGFDEVEKALKEVQKEIDEVAGGKFVKFKELLTDEFMSKHTSHNSMEQFFDRSPFEVKTQEDFNRIEENELNAFTKETTNYDSFHEMLQHAGTLYMKKELEKKGIKTN